MTTHMPMLGRIMFGAVVLAYGCPLYAADPTHSTMFSVAVLKDQKDFFKTQLSNEPAFKAAKCQENPGDYMKSTTRNFPMGKPWFWDDYYARTFYECDSPQAELYGAFGAASLKTVQNGTSMKIKEPVRVTQDTAIRPVIESVCSLSMCQNGTYRRTTNVVTCPQC